MDRPPSPEAGYGDENLPAKHMRLKQTPFAENVAHGIPAV